MANNQQRSNDGGLNATQRTWLSTSVSVIVAMAVIGFPILASERNRTEDLLRNEIQAAESRMNEKTNQIKADNERRDEKLMDRLDEIYKLLIEQKNSSPSNKP